MKRGFLNAASGAKQQQKRQRGAKGSQGGAPPASSATPSPSPTPAGDKAAAEGQGVLPDSGRLSHSSSSDSDSGVSRSPSLSPDRPSDDTADMPRQGSDATAGPDIEAMLRGRLLAQQDVVEVKENALSLGPGTRWTNTRNPHQHPAHEELQKGKLAQLRHLEVVRADESIRPSEGLVQGASKIASRIAETVNGVFANRDVITMRVPHSGVHTRIPLKQNVIQTVPAGSFWESSKMAPGMAILSVGGKSIYSVPAAKLLEPGSLIPGSTVDVEVEVQRQGPLQVSLAGSWLRGTATRRSAVDVRCPIAATREMVSRLTTFISVKHSGEFRIVTDKAHHGCDTYTPSLVLQDSHTGLLCNIHLSATFEGSTWPGIATRFPADVPLVRVVHEMSRSWGLYIPVLAIELMAAALSESVNCATIGWANEAYTPEAGYGARLAAFMQWYGVVFDWGRAEVAPSKSGGMLVPAFRPRQAPTEDGVTSFVVIDPVSGGNVADLRDFHRFLLMLARSSAVYSIPSRSLEHIMADPR